MTIKKSVRDTENNGMKDVRISLVTDTVILILVVAMMYEYPLTLEISCQVSSVDRHHYSNMDCNARDSKCMWTK